MFQNQRSLRERIRDFQKNYKLADDDLIMILIASLENELRELNSVKVLLTQSLGSRLELFEEFLNDLKSHFNSENLKEIEQELARTVAVADRLRGIPETINSYFQGKFQIPRETLKQIASTTFQEYRQEVRKREIWILISIFGFWIVSGIFLFSWGKFEGRSETLKTVQGIERWAQTSEGQTLRELGRLNPHLLECAGQGLEKIRLGNKTICKPTGGSRGWILP